MEEIMRDLADKNLLDVVAFRYFNAAGCSPDGQIGENHDPETHLIPNLCKSFLKGEHGNFQVFGTDYPTRDGSCVRDYIHVDDLIDAHFMGMTYLKNRQGFFDFNLGSESGTSVLEMIKLFEHITGKKLPVEMKGRRAGDPPSLIGNSAKAKAELNFNPKYSAQDCIAHTLNYLRKKG